MNFKGTRYKAKCPIVTLNKGGTRPSGEWVSARVQCSGGLCPQSGHGDKTSIQKKNRKPSKPFLCALETHHEAEQLHFLNG